MNQNLQSFRQHKLLFICLINISALCDRAAELESYPILAVNRQKTDMDLNLLGEKDFG